MFLNCKTLFVYIQLAMCDENILNLSAFFIDDI